MRIQLALNVRDIDEAVAYYSKLFATEPHKRREGYANFALDTPPLKLVLIENPEASGRLNHLGVEVLEETQLEATHARLDAAGLVDNVQQRVTCCHATQDKIWSKEPQGLNWEWYRITDDDPERTSREGPCCGVDEEVGAPCCA